MKNNTTKKASAKKKLLPAAGSLLISAAMLGTSTYAWFTMNKEVTVTGMQMHTKVGSNLLITEDTISHGGDNVDSLYKTDIKQIRKCLLEPASTVDGKSYWYTVEAAANGAKLSGASWIEYGEDAGTDLANETAGKFKYDKTFNDKYTIAGTGASGAFQTSDMTAANGPAYGYVDYNFYIKATTDTASQHVAMTKCNLLYNGNPLSGTDGSGAIPNIDKAWRVAMFVDETAASTEVDTQTNLVTVLKPAGATNQSGADVAVNAAGGTTSVTNANANADFGTISSSGTTAYYKVTIRLWLEGEDTTCTSETYAKLTNMYSLDLKFELQNDGQHGVNQIQSDSSWKAKLNSGS